MNIDRKGYPRDEDGKLIHRKNAYKKYKQNHRKYHLPFSKYQVHHKDGNKKNFNSHNLKILTPSEHRGVHGISSPRGDYEYGLPFFNSILYLTMFLIWFLFRDWDIASFFKAHIPFLIFVYFISLIWLMIIFRAHIHTFFLMLFAVAFPTLMIATNGLSNTGFNQMKWVYLVGIIAIILIIKLVRDYREEEINEALIFNPIVRTYSFWKWTAFFIGVTALIYFML